MFKTAEFYLLTKHISMTILFTYLFWQSFVCIVIPVVITLLHHL